MEASSWSEASLVLGQQTYLLQESKRYSCGFLQCFGRQQVEIKNILYSLMVSLSLNFCFRFGLFWAYNEPTIFLKDLDLIKRVQVTDFDHFMTFGGHQNFFSSYGGILISFSVKDSVLTMTRKEMSLDWLISRGKTGEEWRSNWHHPLALLGSRRIFLPWMKWLKR